MVENNAGTLVGSMWALTIISLLFVIARIFLKARYGRSFAGDDWALCLAWCLLVVYTSLTHVATRYGLGYHFNDIPAENLSPANKFLTIGEFFAVLALQTSKTSFAITLLRLVTQRSLKWILRVIIITLNIVMGLDAIFTFASCIPTEKIWIPELPGRCWKPEVIVKASIFAGVYSGLMDLLLAGFPFLILIPLKMERKEKCGICFAMSLGFFAGISAFIKSGYMPQLGRWQDVTYSSYIILIWAAAEASITMIAACVPYLRLAIPHNHGTHSSRGYEIHDEELQLGRVIPSFKEDKDWEPDWTNSSQSEANHISVPEKVRVAHGVMIDGHSTSPIEGRETGCMCVNFVSD